MEKRLQVILAFFVCFTMMNVVTLDASSSIGETVNFAVVSDLHYYDASLGTTGAAFEAYLTMDRKMLAESKAIMDAAMSMIKQDAPQFLLIPGDLTKDGEKLNHQKVAEYLKDMENNGIQVYVVPGNHDILNSHAVQYEDSTMTPVETVTPEEFASIYGEFGYDDALYRDPNSLSYIAEPAAGMWLFALDPCLYLQNTETKTVTSGKFSAETLQWIGEKLQEAKAQKKYVIGMYHHASLEHYIGQKAFWPEYILEDYTTTSAFLAAGGMQMVFCGHYHAQDIVVTEIDGSPFFDIMTGSLVTYPSPYRLVSISPELNVDISSKFVTEIDYDTQGKTFPEYAHGYLVEGLQVLAMVLLTSPPEYGGYGLTQVQASLVAPLAVDAFAAHYAGDEMPSTDVMQLLGQLMASSDSTLNLMGQVLGSLWTDLPPSDNAASFKTFSTRVELTHAGTVDNFKLHQNYPNPFNPETIISYTLPVESEVRVVVYDVNGREVKTLVDDINLAGNHQVVFDGSSLASGMYFYQLIVDGVQQVSRKMLLLK